MDPILGLTLFLCTGICGITVCSILRILNPPPPRPPLTRLDAIDEELTRLHGDTEDYSSVPDWMRRQIDLLNRELVNAKKEDDKV